jgi:hypothetical protein
MTGIMGIVNLTQALLGQGSAAGVQLGLKRLRRQGFVSAEPAGRAILYRLNGPGVHRNAVEPDPGRGL